jgi:hypothetical protein
MKKILLFFMSVLSFGAVTAQLPDYGVAPDFTVTDLDNNTQNLYDILDQDKPVVIDLYATWCNPCWSYHQTYALENLWTANGPSGTDELVVMGIESQPGNSVDQINGITGTTGNAYTSNTAGNWLNGISYPMIDDSNPADLFNLEYFPTVVLVCPDRSVTEVGQASTSSLQAAAASCPSSASQANDGAVLAYVGSAFACGDVPMEVVIQNKGTAAYTSATIKVMNGTTELASVPWSGNLSAYEYDEVDLGSVAVPGPGTYTIEIAESDANTGNNTLSVTLGNVEIATIDVVVEVTTDYYPGETSWEIRNSSGAVVAAESYAAGTEDGAGAGGADANKTHTHPVTLPMNECFTVNLFDDYGDGIQQFTGQPLLDYGIEVKADWGGVIVAQDGDFEDEASAAMKTDGTSSIDEATLSSTMNVYPNPATDNTLVTFNTNDKSSIRIELLNAVGARVMIKDFGSMNAGTQMIPVSTSNLSSGIYMINIYVNDALVTKRLSVQK